METANYEPAVVEERWRRIWSERRVFEAAPPRPGRRDVHIATAPPFTSGNVHMGHVRSYALGDAAARWRRLSGDNVVYGIGFDTFGLPVEIAAIERQMPPAVWVARCMETMREEFDRLGFSFDWTRAYATSEPETYRWTQWVFLWLLEHDLVYRAEAPVDWCPSCCSVLAKLQVEDGRCWRCASETEIRVRSAWFVRITAYLPELERELLDDDPRARWIQGQRNLLGRVEGVEVELALGERRIIAFTPYADRVREAAVVALSPEDPLLAALASPHVKEALVQLHGSHRERAQRDASQVPLVDTELSAALSDGRRLKIVATPYVNTALGGSAALLVPGASRTDAELVKRLGIEPGRSESAIDARPAVRFRQKDVSISRQRCWGTPIPVVFCERCGMVPYSRDQLPLVLPTDVIPTGEGNALAKLESFVQTSCPRCNGAARRETDTIDCWFDSVWFLCAHAVPAERRRTALFDDPELRRWLPVTLEVCGIDIPPNQMGFRFLAKAGREHGLLDFLADAEPIRDTLMHEMILAGGRKMSKHLGNAVAPADLMREYGADALRLAVLSAAAPGKTLRWMGDEGVQRARSFLAELWVFVHQRLPHFEPRSKSLDAVVATSTKPLRRIRLWLETAVSRSEFAYERHDFHVVADNLRRLFESLERYESEALRIAPLQGDDYDAELVVLRELLLLLSPLAPHVCEELWSQLGFDGLIAETTRRARAQAPPAAIEGLSDPDGPAA